MSACRRRDDRQPCRLVDDFYAEFRRLLELAARTRSGDDQVGLGRHRPGGARAERFGLRLGLVATEAFETAGENDGLAGHRRLPHLVNHRLNVELAAKVSEDFLIMWF